MTYDRSAVLRVVQVAEEFSEIGDVGLGVELE